MKTTSTNTSQTKAEQIMALYDGVRTTREIAEIVGCDPAYVRVVARQRASGGGVSDIDRRYRASPLGKAARRRAARKRIDLTHATSAAVMCVAQQTGDREAANLAARLAYAAARAAGADTKSASKAKASARTRVMFQTRDRAAGRAAARAAYRKAKKARQQALEAAE